MLLMIYCSRTYLLIFYWCYIVQGHICYYVTDVILFKDISIMLLMLYCSRHNCYYVTDVILFRSHLISCYWYYIVQGISVIMLLISYCSGHICYYVIDIILFRSHLLLCYWCYIVQDTLLQCYWCYIVQVTSVIMLLMKTRRKGLCLQVIQPYKLQNQPYKLQPPAL